MNRGLRSALISAVIPGLGQVIEEQTQRGIFIFFLTIVIYYGLIFLLQWIILIPFWHAFVVLDAYKAGKKKEEEQKEKEIEEFSMEEETEEESYMKFGEME